MTRTRRAYNLGKFRKFPWFYEPYRSGVCAGHCSWCKKEWITKAKKRVERERRYMQLEIENAIREGLM